MKNYSAQYCVHRNPVLSIARCSAHVPRGRWYGNINVLGAYMSPPRRCTMHKWCPQNVLKGIHHEFKGDMGTML